MNEWMDGRKKEIINLTIACSQNKVVVGIYSRKKEATEEYLKYLKNCIKKSLPSHSK